MISISRKLKLLSLILMGIACSTPALACGGDQKFEVSLKKQDYHHKDCIALFLEFPETVGAFNKAELSLTYNDGGGQKLDVWLAANDYKKNDGKLTASFCLTEELLKKSSISIMWTLDKDGMVGLCNASAGTGNLYELLASGGTKVIDPF